jgi:hypothetical protein
MQTETPFTVEALAEVKQQFVGLQVYAWNVLQAYRRAKSKHGAILDHLRAERAKLLVHPSMQERDPHMREALVRDELYELYKSLHDAKQDVLKAQIDLHEIKAEYQTVHASLRAFEVYARLLEKK